MIVATAGCLCQEHVLGMTTVENIYVFDIGKESWYLTWRRNSRADAQFPADDRGEVDASERGGSHHRGRSYYDKLWSVLPNHTREVRTPGLP